MTDLATELAQAREKIAELERMLDTFQAVSPHDPHPSIAETVQAQKRAALAEQERRQIEYELYMKMRELESIRQNKEWML